MSKQIKLRLYFFGIAIIAGYLMWLGGVIPFTLRAQVRQALGLYFLSPSLQIEDSYTDSWGDYIFRAEVTFSENSIEFLTSGREFTKYTFTEQDFIEDPELKHVTMYSWHTSDEGYASCSLLIDDSGTQGTVKYAAD